MTNLAPVQNPDRLSTLKQLEILDSPAEEAFDRLTRLASKVIQAPVSLVSIVDSDRQFFKSLFGLPEPYASQRETPLSHSFCQYVAATGEPLIVTDARQHPELKTNLAIPDLNVIAYLGMPLTTTQGVELGSFCVIDSKPRVWTEREIEIVRELALSTMSEIELKAQVKARQEAEKLLVERNNQYRRAYHFAGQTLKYMKDVIRTGTNPKELTAYVEQMEKELSRL